MDYANKKNILLNIKDQNCDKIYPLSKALNNNNIEIVELILDYANEKDITLDVYPDINKKINTLNIDQVI